MATQIVRYSNDLNKINLSSLKEQEQNLLFEILLRLNDQGTAPMSFTVSELNKMIFKNNTRMEITELVKSLKDHFFSLNFTQLLDDGDQEIYRTMNLFSVMEIEIDKKTKHLKKLTLQVAEPFAYIINELTGNFTRFELAEFVMLQSKYSKILFRLLKQFRTSGWAQFEWEEFISLMGIPASYKIGDIEKRVLKPVVRELNWDDGQPDLFKDLPSRGVDHPAFRNLSYEKIRSKSGKGRKVIGIKFTFDPEKASERAQLVHGEVIKKQPKTRGKTSTAVSAAEPVSGQSARGISVHAARAQAFLDRYTDDELPEVLEGMPLHELSELFYDLQPTQDPRKGMLSQFLQQRAVTEIPA